VYVFGAGDGVGVSADAAGLCTAASWVHGIFSSRGSYS